MEYKHNIFNHFCSSAVFDEGKTNTSDQGVSRSGPIRLQLVESSNMVYLSEHTDRPACYKISSPVDSHRVDFRLNNISVDAIEQRSSK
eukprot:6633630-Ditylum_brightwellii.AAC.1